MSIYSVCDNKFYKKLFLTPSPVEFKALGATLYPAHSTTKGYIERCITEGIKNANHTLFRMVLIFEGYKGSDVLKSPGWKAVETALDLGEKYNVGITVEIGSSLLSYLEKKGEDPYDPKWDELFTKVLKKACRLYKNHQSLFCFTVMNEFGPYGKPQAYFDRVFARMLKSAEQIKKFSKNKILVASGGLLHLSEKSGGKPRPVTCPWVDNGNTPVDYWKGVYTCPSVDFNMIHIYSSIDKINNNESEWSNLEKYYDFCSTYKRPIIVDEFGCRLPTDTPTEVGEEFLQAVWDAITKIPVEKRPPIIEMWNLAPQAFGYDWFPTSYVLDPLYQTMKEMRLDLFPSNEHDVNYEPKTFQLSKTVQVIDSEEIKVDYAFPAGKFKSKFIYNKTFDPVAISAPIKGIAVSVITPISVSSTKMILRFFLEFSGFGKTLTTTQEFNSVKQNSMVPGSYAEQNYFVDFTNGDIKEFGANGNGRHGYNLIKVRIQLISNKPVENSVGTFTFTNLRFAWK